MKDPDTALLEASNSGLVEIVKRLVKDGANVNCRNNGAGHAPLHFACARSNMKIIRILIENGANVNSADGKGRTPLHIIAHLGNLPIAFVLIDNGADISIKDKKNKTAIQVAKSIDVALELKNRIDGSKITSNRQLEPESRQDGPTGLNDTRSCGEGEIASLRAAVEELTAKNATLKKLAENQTINEEKLTKKKNYVENLMKEQTSEIKILMEQLKMEKNQQKDKIASLQKEKGVLEKTIEKLRSEKTMTESLKSEKFAEMDRVMNQENEDIKSSLKQLQAENYSLKTVAKTQKMTLDSLMKDNRALETALQQGAIEIEVARDRIRAESVSFNIAMDKKETQIELLKSENTYLKAEVGHDMEFALLKEDRDAAVSVLKMQQLELQKLRKDKMCMELLSEHRKATVDILIDRIKDDKSSLHAKVKKQELQIFELKKEKDALKLLLDQKKAESEPTVDGIKSERESTHDKKDHQVATIKTLQKEKEEVESQLTHAVHATKTCMCTLELLQAKVKTLQSTTDVANINLQKLRKDKAGMEIVLNYNKMHAHSINLLRMEQEQKLRKDKLIMELLLLRATREAKKTADKLSTRKAALKTVSAQHEADLESLSLLKERAERATLEMSSLNHTISFLQDENKALRTKNGSEGEILYHREPSSLKTQEIPRLKTAVNTVKATNETPQLETSSQGETCETVESKEENPATLGLNLNDWEEMRKRSASLIARKKKQKTDVETQLRQKIDKEREEMSDLKSAVKQLVADNKSLLVLMDKHQGGNESKVEATEVTALVEELKTENESLIAKVKRLEEDLKTKEVDSSQIHIEVEKLLMQHISEIRRELSNEANATTSLETPEEESKSEIEELFARHWRVIKAILDEVNTRADIDRKEAARKTSSNRELLVDAALKMTKEVEAARDNFSAVLGTFQKDNP